MAVKTLICADCRQKFDVDPKVLRRFSGLCDECSARTVMVGGTMFEIVPLKESK
jgi:hypothetical protein